MKFKISWKCTYTEVTRIPGSRSACGQWGFLFRDLQNSECGEGRRVPEVFQVAWLGERGGGLALGFCIEFCVVLLFEFCPFYMLFAPHIVWGTIGLTHSAEHCQLARGPYHFLTSVYCWSIELRKGSELVHTATDIIKRPGHFKAVSRAGSVCDPQWTSGGGSSADGDVQLGSLWGASCGVGTGHQSIMF